jgi:glutamine phosphoribosylpyrophosphate amidotransferase
MGTKSEFEAEFGVSCTVDNDSEVFLRKIEDAHSPEDIIRKADGFIGAISGSFAATLLVDDLLFAGHNPRRPLWRCMAYGAKWYASTEDIFRRAGFTGAEPVRVGFEQA